MDNQIKGKGVSITAEKRMFAKSIVLSDAFLDMPLSARCLYFTFGMLADDDGFVGNPKSIIRQCGASEDDMKVLLGKKFIISFETGVIIIKHWRINNYLRNDRHHTTTYVEEMNILGLDNKGAYTTNPEKMVCGIPTANQLTDNGIPTDGHMETEYSIDKNSKDNNIYIVVQEVISYLNEKSGKDFKTKTKTTISHIKARVKEGFTVDDFKKVIDIKVSKWKNDPKMKDYIRPETLFGTKFEGYLNEAPQKKPIPEPIKEEPKQEEELDIRENYTSFSKDTWTEDEIEDAVSKRIITETEAHDILWG